MSAFANTNEGAAAPAPNASSAVGAQQPSTQAPPVAAATAPANEVGQQTPPQQGQPKAEAKPAEPQKRAPAEYKFDAPFDAEVLKAYGDVARELDLSQEDAQKVLAKVAPVLQERHQASVQAQYAAWDAAVAADKEITGDKPQENQAAIARAINEFATPELRKLLDPPDKEGAGLGKHPEFQRLFLRIGKAITPDTKVVTGEAGGSRPPKTFEERAAEKFERNRAQQKQR